MWKRAIETTKELVIVPGQWLSLAEPVRMHVDLTSVENAIRFFVSFATVHRKGGAGGGVLERRPLPPSSGDIHPGDMIDPYKEGGTGYYQVDFVGRRGKSNFGAGSYCLWGKVDQGRDPGSMTVEFCVVVSPIQSGPPLSGAEMLGCPPRSISD